MAAAFVRVEPSPACPYCEGTRELLSVSAFRGVESAACLCADSRWVPLAVTVDGGGLVSVPRQSVELLPGATVRGGDGIALEVFAFYAGGPSAFPCGRWCSIRCSDGEGGYESGSLDLYPPGFAGMAPPVAGPCRVVLEVHRDFGVELGPMFAGGPVEVRARARLLPVLSQ